MSFVLPVRYQDSNLSGSALLTDPPYSARTHKGHNKAHAQVLSATGQATRRALSYASWNEQDVAELITWSADRIAGWRACFTSHDLVPAYLDAYEKIGLYAFAPVAVIIPRPRLLGDGPSSWLVYLCVGRPRTKAYSRWRCLPGMYRSSCEQRSPVVGAKRVGLMQEIVRDYSNPGDSIVDTCAGAGATGVAAFAMGRVFRGAEASPELAAYANERILKSFDEVLPEPVASAKLKTVYVEESENESENETEHEAA